MDAANTLITGVKPGWIVKTNKACLSKCGHLVLWMAAANGLAATTGCGPGGRGSHPPAPSAPPPPPLQSAALPAVPKPGKISTLELGTFFALQQAGAALIYDVRPGIYFRFGHIPAAISWPKSKYESQLACREDEIRHAALAKRPVVLYCTDLACPDSLSVATRLAARGHSVAILQGGFHDWQASNLPTE